MSRPIDLPGLARELEVKSVDLLACAQELGLPVRRVAARLTAAQANRLRQAHADGKVKKLKDRSTVGIAPYVPPPREVSGRCVCCALPFTFREGREPDACPPCLERQHRPNDDSDGATLHRLQDHHDWWRDRCIEAARNASDYRSRMQSALASRDKWKRALAEVIVAHAPAEDGTCCCGTGDYPCITRRVLDDANPGISKQVEQLEGLSEEDLQKFLHGDDSAIDRWE